MFPLIFDGTAWEKFLLMFLGILVKIWALNLFCLGIDTKKANNYTSQMKRQFFIIRLFSTLILMLLFIFSLLCLTLLAKRILFLVRRFSNICERLLAAERKPCLGWLSISWYRIIDVPVAKYLFLLLKLLFHPYLRCLNLSWIHAYII